MGTEHTPYAPAHCPTCAGALVITRLQCPACGTEVAEDLLAALDAAPDAGARSTGPSAAFGPESMPTPPWPPGPLKIGKYVGPPVIGKHRRSLVIQVKEGGDAKVNVRVPLSLARA